MNRFSHARYLAAYPEDQKKCKKFADIPLTTLPSNLEFCTQTLTVMTFLEKLVENMGGEYRSMLAVKGQRYKNFGDDSLPFKYPEVGYPQFRVL